MKWDTLFCFPTKINVKLFTYSFFCVLRIFMSMCCVYLFFFQIYLVRPCRQRPLPPQQQQLQQHRHQQQRYRTSTEKAKVRLFNGKSTPNNAHLATSTYIINLIIRARVVFHLFHESFESRSEFHDFESSFHYLPLEM